MRSPININISEEAKTRYFKLKLKLLSSDSWTKNENKKVWQILSPFSNILQNVIFEVLKIEWYKFRELSFTMSAANGALLTDIVLSKQKKSTRGCYWNWNINENTKRRKSQKHSHIVVHKIERVSKTCLQMKKRIHIFRKKFI